MNTENQNSRRKFLKQGAAGVFSLTLYSLFHKQAFADESNLLDENGPQALALGYKHDAAQVDKAKYTKFADNQFCHNCNLYQGAGTEGVGGCPIFAGKQVKAGGWCSAWVKKAG